MENKKCPKCKGTMLMMYGWGWDYDKWVCAEKDCHFEEELTTTSYPKIEDERRIKKRVSDNDEKLLEEVRKQQ